MTQSLPSARLTLTRALDAPCVLRDVGERLRDEEVGCRLRRRREPLVRHLDDRDRHGRALRERRQSRTEALLGQHGRVDAAGELMQLAERGAQLGVGFGEELCGAVCVRSELRTRELEREAEAEQALLGAVVEVALESAPLLVAGRDDARPRGAKLRQLDAQLGLEALVLECESRRRARRREQSPPLQQYWIVHERSDRRIRRPEHRHCPVRAGSRKRDGAALHVDEASALG